MQSPTKPEHVRNYRCQVHRNKLRTRFIPSIACFPRLPPIRFIPLCDSDLDREWVVTPSRSHQTPRPSSSSENPTPRLPSDLSDGCTERGLFGEDELDRAQDPPIQCQHRPLHARLVGALPVQYVDALPYLVHPPVSHRVLSE